MKLQLHRSFHFHTFGIVPMSIISPSLQYSIMPCENPMSPIAICRIYSTYS